MKGLRRILTLRSEPPRAEADRKRHDHEEGVAEGAQSGRIGTPCCINDGGRGLAYRPSEAYGERIHKWLPFLVEERQGFPPRIKQILTRAAQACLIKPNARKAYPLAPSRVRPATIRGPHLRIGHRRLIHTRKGRCGGQMSAIEAVVITALGTAAAVVWALCLEAWDKKSR